MSTVGRPRNFDEQATLVRIAESFRKNGYEKTTFEQLVNDSGLSRSSLYSTYGGKEELLDKSMRMYLETEYNQVIKKVSDDEQSAEAMQCMIGNFTALSEKSSNDCLIRQIMLRNANSTGDSIQVSTIKKCVNKLWKTIAKAVGRRQKPDRAAKEQPSELKDEERAAIFLGLIHGSAVIARNGGNAELIRTMQSAAQKVLFLK